jgi:hypothetical protein
MGAAPRAIKLWGSSGLVANVVLSHRGGMSTRFAIALLAPVLSFASPAIADEVFKVGGFGLTRVMLASPSAGTRAVAVLLPGGDGVMNIDEAGNITQLRGNSLVRTWPRLRSSGLAVALADRDVDLGQLTTELRRRGFQRVVWVGTSRGTLRIASALPSTSGPTRPDAIVLTAGFLDQTQPENVQRRFGSPAILPPTLVVHHRGDLCRLTPPSGVDGFVAWSAGRARVVWVTGGVAETGNPCQAAGPHGFRGTETAMVSAIASFARR